MSNLTKLTLDKIKFLGKQDIKDFKKEITDKVELGTLSALEVNMFFKFLEKLYNGDANKNNGLYHELKEASETEYDFNKDGFSLTKGNFNIEKGEAGIRYDYSKDEEWCRLKLLCEEANKNREEREKFLKGINPDKPLEILDPDTGEVVKTYAPVKTSTTILKYSIK